jgi:hypothetical protein
MRIRLTILLASGWFTLGVASAELPALAKKFYADDPIWTGGGRAQKKAGRLL